MNSPEIKDTETLNASEPTIPNDGVDKETSPGSQSPLEAVKHDHQDSSQAVHKATVDDADTSSSLSAAPSPLTTHRPTSSKTSIDDQPLTPRDSPEKASKDTDGASKDVQEHPVHDAQPKSEKQSSPTPTQKPVEQKVTLPEDKLGTILQLNAELIKYGSPL